MDLSPLLPTAGLLLLAVALDVLFGDPVYRWHPIRLLGALLVWTEKCLRGVGADGRLGGGMLFAALIVSWGVPLLAVVVLAEWIHPQLATAAHLFVLYSLIALGDLLKHGDAVNLAAGAGDVSAARIASAQLVGRDSDRMDALACRRAAIESLAENLVDGFVSPLFWYVLVGLPGIALFKVASTMDSMVGYKTAKYLRFGWCGARLDDLLNLIPARLCYLLLAGTAMFLPGCSGLAAARIGWRQHAIVPGPNAGWSEAAMAGAIQRRLAGPIWEQGVLVNDVWLGDPSDAVAGTGPDYRRARLVLLATAGVVVASAVALIVLMAS